MTTRTDDSLAGSDVSSSADEILSHVKEYGGDLTARAVDLAADLHEGQYRKTPADREPQAYITHPLRAALRLASAGITDDRLLAAAVLHDTVEDCSPVFAELYGHSLGDAEHSSSDARCVLRHHLRDEFGLGVARAVSRVSNPTGMRRDQYHEHIADAVIVSPESALIKFADWWDNSMSLVDLAASDGIVDTTSGDLPRKQRRQREKTRRQAEKYRAVADLYESRPASTVSLLADGGKAHEKRTVAVSASTVDGGDEIPPVGALIPALDYGLIDAGTYAVLCLHAARVRGELDRLIAD